MVQELAGQGVQGGQFSGCEAGGQQGGDVGGVLRRGGPERASTVELVDSTTFTPGAVVYRPVPLEEPLLPDSAQPA
ncbi:hypothetical protein AB0J90_26520 [Micromonospora sp. NPDC049523]|uniref:hypothetical protein n=1 Tax=Micromonospora sp. NPDC049523 TaxID=3155921 RepID=UPI003439C6BB